jgi:hypothetical protein
MPELWLATRVGHGGFIRIRSPSACIIARIRFTVVKTQNCLIVANYHRNDIPVIRFDLHSAHSTLCFLGCLPKCFIQLRGIFCSQRCFAFSDRDS